MLRRFHRLPFQHRAALALGIPVIIWLLVSAAGVAVLDQSIRNNARLIDNQRSVLFASEYLSQLHQVRAAERGYLLTSAPDTLLRYREAIRATQRTHSQLLTLSRDDVEQRERLEQVQDFFEQWLYEASRARVTLREQFTTGEVQTAQALEFELLSALLSHLARIERGQAIDESLDSLQTHIRALEEQRRNAERPEPRPPLSSLLQEHARAIEADDRRAAARTLIRLAEALLPMTRELIHVGREIEDRTIDTHGRLLFQSVVETMEAFRETAQQALRHHQVAVPTGLRNIQQLVWLGFIAGLVLMALLGWWVTRRIHESVESINIATEELARGNMAARAKVLGTGKAAGLAARFNMMAELVEARNRQSSVLAELGELLHSCQTMQEAVDVFSGFVDRLFPEQPGMLFLVSSDRLSVNAAAAWNDAEAYSAGNLKVEDCWALRMTRLYANHPDGVPRCDHLSGPTRHSACIPLPAFGELVGMLFIVVEDDESNAGKIRRESQIRFADSVAEQLSLALANVKLRDTLKEQTIRDPLTQLYNRRHLDEVMAKELHRAERHSESLAFVMCDIDEFKSFNDVHGHDAGDAVLRAVAESFRESLRVEDSVFRLGGEEFLVLLPDTALPETREVAEALRETIASRKVVHSGSVLPSITISAGIAIYPDHGRDGATLMSEADQALLSAKTKGRNLVEIPGNHDEHES